MRPLEEGDPKPRPLTLSAVRRHSTNERWVTMNKNVLQDIFENTLKTDISVDVGRASGSRQRPWSPPLRDEALASGSRQRSWSPPRDSHYSDISEATCDSDTKSEGCSESTSYDSDIIIVSDTGAPFHRNSQVHSARRYNAATSASPSQAYAHTKECLGPMVGSQQLRGPPPPGHHRESENRPGARSGFPSATVPVPIDPNSIYSTERPFSSEHGLLPRYVRNTTHKATGPMLAGCRGTLPHWYSSTLLSSLGHGPPYSLLHTRLLPVRAADDMVIIGSRRPFMRRGSTGNHPQNLTTVDTLLQKRCIESVRMARREERQSVSGSGSELDMDTPSASQYRSQPDSMDITHQSNVPHLPQTFGRTLETRECEKERGLNMYRTGHPNKRKHRTNKMKEKQQWIGISKEAIDGILDELMVSSISGDDSGSDSRSQSPGGDSVSVDSDQSASARDKCNVTFCDKSGQSQSTVIQDVDQCTSRDPQVSERRLQYDRASRCNSAPINSVTQSLSAADCAAPTIVSHSDALCSHSLISSDNTQSDKVGESVGGQSCSSSVSEESTGDTDKSKGDSPTLEATNRGAPKGWVLLTQPLISSMMEEAFTRDMLCSPVPQQPPPDLSPSPPLRDSTSPNSSTRDVTSSDTSTQDATSPPAATRDVTHGDVVDVEDRSSADESTEHIRDGRDKSNCSFQPARADPKVNANERATALLLGAFGLGENSKTEQHRMTGKRHAYAEKNCHKLPRIEQSEIQGMDLRISKRYNEGADCASSKARAVPTDVRTSVLGYDRPAVTPHLTQIPRGSKSQISAHRRVPLSPKRPIGLENATVRLANCNEIAINLATKSKHVSPEYQRVLNTKTYCSNSIRSHRDHHQENNRHNPELLDMVAASTEKTDNPTPLYTHQLSAPQSKGVNLSEGKSIDFPQPFAKHKSLAVLAKPNGGSRSQEPRHGWVVISKDEVHTIMDSLTSQLFDASPEAGPEQETYEHTRENNPDHGDHKHGQNILNDVGDLSPVPGHSSESKAFDVVSAGGGGAKVRSPDVRDEPPPKEEPRKDVRSPDEEFRRTAIDALKAVYRHEDGLEIYHADTLPDNDKSQHRESNSPEPHISSFSQDSLTSSNYEESVAVTTIIRQRPVRQIPEENNLVNLENQSFNDQSSPTDQDSVTTTEVPAHGVDIKAFKWKRSILQRVQDTRPATPLPFPANSDSNIAGSMSPTQGTSITDTGSMSPTQGTSSPNKAFRRPNAFGNKKSKKIKRRL